MTAPVPQSRPDSPLAKRYAEVRAQTLALAAPLSEADCQVQSMPDASPTKWHLAHVTWFFETFILERFEANFQPFHEAYRVLFNSYYQGVGDQHPRPQRGLITRPDLTDIKAYRAQVDARMATLLARPASDELAELVTLGLHHEQQHQELLLTDIKHLLAQNPLAPVYRAPWPLSSVASVPAQWVGFAGGTVQIGHKGDGFSFDNELPRHAVLLAPYALSNRLVTHGEWLAFMEDGGYTDARWWMAAGWDWVLAQRAQAPLYWQTDGDGGWTNFTLHGRAPIDPHTPVVHINWFEADAYARWRSAQDGEAIRLPTEAEWEHAAEASGAAWTEHGNFSESRALHPMPPPRARAGLLQMGGDVWEWTASSYLPYPGYRAWAGAVGEYNGKFMINQMVLRGGSCATPRSHIRTSYRNFFPTDARWQFSGLRLARDA
ncbi:ergothioneine biosynthesis protein EgtB [Hydrogenophaga sp.]|uniref:ergothioneine biosynthesis protein EgtB n=1 Tax=Hydrogenophaga sp. TaxID=1904254 RepID=UPI00261FF0F8|nr:ergothioneine biosynthesis protein EgtB [Hydrogenophaga sp.]MDM7948370.1 ergothioneine biosynthesis protein EgtB [Hydrogenophaga sp.]